MPSALMAPRSRPTPATDADRPGGNWKHALNDTWQIDPGEPAANFPVTGSVVQADEQLDVWFGLLEVPPATNITLELLSATPLTPRIFLAAAGTYNLDYWLRPLAGEELRGRVTLETMQGQLLTFPFSYRYRVAGRTRAGQSGASRCPGASHYGKPASTALTNQIFVAP